MHNGRASGLAATGVAPATNISLTGRVMSYSYSDGKELVTFKPGNRNVVTRYEGDSTGMIEIETSDMSVYAAHKVGNKYTDVTLSLEAAADGAGTEDGSAATVVLSHAALVSKSEPSKDATNRMPVSFRLRFELDWHVGLATAPTFTGPTTS